MQRMRPNRQWQEPVNHITEGNILFCGEVGRKYMNISAHFLRQDITVQRVSSISSLWAKDVCHENISVLVFVDVDSLGGPTQVVDRLLLFRQDLPHVTIVLLSSEFSSDDFSVDRLAICDCSIRCDQSLSNLEIALEQAFLNNSVWLARQSKRSRHDDVFQVRLTVALVLSVISGLAAGLFTLLELKSWWYAVLAYIGTAQATLITLLILPFARTSASLLLAWALRRKRTSFFFPKAKFITQRFKRLI